MVSKELLIDSPRRRAVLMLAVSASFMATGALMVRDGVALGWFVEAVFAIGASSIATGLLVPSAVASRARRTRRARAASTH